MYPDQKSLSLQRQHHRHSTSAHPAVRFYYNKPPEIIVNFYHSIGCKFGTPIDARITFESIYIAYQPVRTVLPGSDIYRADFYPAIMVYQKDKPGCKPVFGPDIGYHRALDSQDNGHRHRAVGLFSPLELAATTVFARAWSPYLFLCA